MAKTNSKIKCDATLINELLEKKRFKLTFPEELEKSFKRFYSKESVKNLPSNFLLVMAVNLMLSLLFYLQINHLEKEHLTAWVLEHVAVSTCALVAFFCGTQRKFDQWYETYIAVCAIPAIVIALIWPYYYDNELLKTIISLAIIYEIMVLYTSVGLSFSTASIICSFGGIFSLVYLILAGFEINWVTFINLYLGPNFLGMMLCYQAERRYRISYLQSLLIRYEKEHNVELAERMKEMSQEDSLTGLANRRYFDEQSKEIWRQALLSHTNVALVFVDIDDFKKYNDYYGHMMGDECIKSIAKMIEAQAETDSGLVARYGGEEFITIYSGVHAGELEYKAKRLLQIVRNARIQHEGSSVSNSVTISIGVASCIPSTQIEIDDLLLEADMNLYESKEKGRDRFTISELMYSNVPEERNSESIKSQGTS